MVSKLGVSKAAGVSSNERNKEGGQKGQELRSEFLTQACFRSCGPRAAIRHHLVALGQPKPFVTAPQNPL
jgi:hypothetical protein